VVTNAAGPAAGGLDSGGVSVWSVLPLVFMAATLILL
jgi:hypothetical protein